MNIFRKRNKGQINDVVTDTAHSTPPLNPSENPILTEAELQEEHPLTEIIRFALIALIIVVPIRWFVAQPFIVSGASMEQTFHNGEYLIVDQISYYFEEPERGDVIIFRYPQDPSKFFIKRIVGIPGDTVKIDGNVVSISNEEFPEGQVLLEPYVANMEPNTQKNETLTENEYFVMGDNRDHSSDSRTWGVLSRDKIVGRAFLRLFPVTKASVFPGKYDIEDELKTTTDSSS